MAKPKIKPSNIKQGLKILVPEPINYDNYPPIFSLEKVQSGKYCFSNLNVEHKAKFADAIFKRKNILWKDIKNTGRHALGAKKLIKNH